MATISPFLTAYDAWVKESRPQAHVARKALKTLRMTIEECCAHDKDKLLSLRALINDDEQDDVAKREDAISLLSLLPRDPEEYQDHRGAFTNLNFVAQ